MAALYTLFSAKFIIKPTSIPVAVRWVFAGVNTFVAFVFVTMGEWMKMHLDMARALERISTWTLAVYARHNPPQ